MKNIIVINGVRQSGVTTKAKEIKEKIESLGLGYRVIFREESDTVKPLDVNTNLPCKISKRKD